MFWSLSHGNMDAGGFTPIPGRYRLPPECWQLLGSGVWVSTATVPACLLWQHALPVLRGRSFIGALSRAKS